MNNQKRTKHRTPTMALNINNGSTTREPPPEYRQQPKPLGGGWGVANPFYWHQIFVIDYVVFKKHTIVQLAWKLPNYCNVSSI